MIDSRYWFADSARFWCAYRFSKASAKAFDLSRETAATRAAYGNGQFANGCLLARRLAERDVRVIQLFYGDGQPIGLMAKSEGGLTFDALLMPLT